jgi:hypothetical protein
MGTFHYAANDFGEDERRGIEVGSRPLRLFKMPNGN